MTPIDPRRTEDLTCKGCVKTVALGHNESLVPNACSSAVEQSSSDACHYRSYRSEKKKIVGLGENYPSYRGPMALDGLGSRSVENTYGYTYHALIALIGRLSLHPAIGQNWILCIS